MRAGQMVDVFVGPWAARTVVRPARDPAGHALAVAEQAREVRGSWDQEDRYPSAVAPKDAGELLHLAWGIIANVGVHHDGWEGQHREWVQAAIRWRNAYFDFDTVPRPAAEPPEVVPAVSGSGNVAVRNPGGWYDVPGEAAWHGSADPRYLRAMLLTGTDEQRRRAAAVLACVERDVSRLVRAWRDWRWLR